MNAEVWITGLGAVTAAGIGTDRLRNALLAGNSCVTPDPALTDLPTGRAPDLCARRVTRHLDRSASMFVAAAEEAWQDAGLTDVSLNPARCGVIEGSSLGPMAELLAAVGGLRREKEAYRPSGLVRFMIGAGGASMAQVHGLQGPVFHVSAGSVSATCAIGEAYHRIASGAADVVVAGGAECPLAPEIVGHFRAAGLVAGPIDGVPACRPFDVQRHGTVLGEGAGVLVLEAAAHAERRGARPRAMLSGYGLSCEAHSMITPDPAGCGVAHAAIDALGCTPPSGISWIKTHGTGTRVNDAAECAGLAAVFGGALAQTPLTSLKPTLGHCLGASGAVEAVAVVVCVEAGVIPATLGTSEVDPALPACTVVRKIQPHPARRVLVLAESFGGRCAALVIGMS